MPSLILLEDRCPGWFAGAAKVCYVLVSMIFLNYDSKLYDIVYIASRSDSLFLLLNYSLFEKLSNEVSHDIL